MIDGYIAGPYTSSNEETVKYRVRQTSKYAAHLASQGFAVYSPVLTWHYIVKDWRLPTDAVYWEYSNSQFLRSAKEIWVLTLEGWQQSIGTIRELIIANHMRIPVKFVDAKSPIAYELQMLDCLQTRGNYDEFCGYTSLIKRLAEAEECHND